MIKTQKTKQLVNKQIKNVRNLIPGNLITLKITAVGAKNVGINEFSFGIPVLVPNAKLGETIQVKILKILNYAAPSNSLVKTSKKFAIAKLSKVVKGLNHTGSASAILNQLENNTKIGTTLIPGTVLEVTINKFGPNSTGIADLSNSYTNVNKLIVKKPAIILGEKIIVTVTRVKKEYAFASTSVIDSALVNSSKNKLGLQGQAASASLMLENLKQSAFKGTKFTVVLPKNAKRYLKHMVFKVASSSTRSNTSEAGVGSFLNNGFGLNYSLEQTLFKKGVVGLDTLVNNQTKTLSVLADTVPTGTILFVKPSLGAKLGNKVQIQITNFFSLADCNPNNEGTGKTRLYNVATAKIIKLNPISATQKKALLRSNLHQMLKSGMHYGEKAITCNARMKNYVWTRKKEADVKFSAGFSPSGRLHAKAKSTLSKNLIDRAFPLIKKGRNIINLLKTRRCLNKALAQLTKYAAKGKTFLFVGTKKAASGLVSRAALFSKKAFFVNTRWLGGMLTNWKTILKSISKISPILKEKQMIIKDILEKRQNIKARLIQKALLLRKKSKLILKKGRLLIQMFDNNKAGPGQVTNILNNKPALAEASARCQRHRKEFLSKGVLLLDKRQQLFVKRQELISQSQTLKSYSLLLTTTYRQLLNNLISARKKLRELKSLLVVSNELHLFKQQAKQENQNLYTVSYNKLKTLKNTNIIANPPKEILNKMVSIIKGQALILKNQSKPSNSLNLKANLKSAKTLILSQLLSKFSLFVPTIKVSITNLQHYISTLQTSLNQVKNKLNIVKNKMLKYSTLKNNLVTVLQHIKQTLQFNFGIIRILRRKLKQIYAQKRLIKFLPKLRYLPTPANKIEQTARFLMKKFVDSKMKYPMDSIYDEKLSRQSKKVAASRKKKWQRLEKYLGGISNMTKIKEKQICNNVAIIIGQQEEMNAVRECQKLGIKMFHIVDTNCNPGFADHFIPANDDARNSIKFILGKFLTRIRLAQKIKIKFKKTKIKK
jgi:small subunit ribosomal protein S2